MPGWLRSVGSGPLTWMPSNATLTAWINQHQRKARQVEDAAQTANVRVGAEIMIAHNLLHGSGQAVLPHPGGDRTQALYRWAAGSCRYRLLVGDCRCLIPRLGQFPTPPISSRTAGLPRSSWG